MKLFNADEPELKTPSPVSDATEQSSEPVVLSELEKAQQERTEYLSQLQRLQAEFDNYRKRVDKETSEMKASASDSLLRDIIPILDNMDLAVLHAKDEHGHIKGEDLLSGVVLIHEQIKNLLEHQGVEEISAEGVFNPKIHEALMTVSQKGAARGTILQTYQRGYTKNGKPFRAAKVSVAQ